MAMLVALGVVHYRKTPKSPDTHHIQKGQTMPDGSAARHRRVTAALVGIKRD